MKQQSFGHSGFDLTPKKTRKRVFLDEIERVIPWLRLVTLVVQYTPEGKTGRPPYAAAVMLRIDLLQQFFGLSDPAMEEALHDVPLYRAFARIDAGITKAPDASSILRFRHLLEQHRVAEKILDTVSAELMARGTLLRTGTVVDATLIDAPSSTKMGSGKRDPELRPSKQGNQWFFGMQAPMGAAAESGLVRASDRQRSSVSAEIPNSRDNASTEVTFGGSSLAAARFLNTAPYRAITTPLLGPYSPTPKGATTSLTRGEQMKARVRAKVEHTFRVIKCQFGFGKVHYKGLTQNTHQLLVMFALSILCGSQTNIAGNVGSLRPRFRKSRENK